MEVFSYEDEFINRISLEHQCELKNEDIGNIREENPSFLKGI